MIVARQSTVGLSRFTSDCARLMRSRTLRSLVHGPVRVASRHLNSHDRRPAEISHRPNSCDQRSSDLSTPVATELPRSLPGLAFGPHAELPRSLPSSAIGPRTPNSRDRCPAQLLARTPNSRDRCPAVPQAELDVRYSHRTGLGTVFSNVLSTFELQTAITPSRQLPTRGCSKVWSWR